jgi:hypothetical protein
MSKFSLKEIQNRDFDECWWLNDMSTTNDGDKRIGLLLEMRESLFHWALLIG